MHTKCQQNWPYVKITDVAFSVLLLVGLGVTVVTLTAWVTKLASSLDSHNHSGSHTVIVITLAVWVTGLAFCLTHRVIPIVGVLPYY